MNKISKNREKKEKIVAELAEKVGKAKALVFANYQGMTHKQLEELKKAVRTAEAELVVTKNTLLKRALDKSEIRNPKSENLELPTATLFAYSDPLIPLKAIAKTIKTLKLPTIKFGIFSSRGRPASGWEVLTESEIMRLATLPSREVLLAQVVYVMKAPLFGLHRALNWNMQKLIMTLKTIEKTK